MPKYSQLKDALIHLIRLRYRPGDRFLTQRELMDKYALSYATVTRALGELERAGYLRTSVRRGTFVAEQTPERPLARPEAGNAINAKSIAFVTGIPISDVLDTQYSQLSNLLLGTLAVCDRDGLNTFFFHPANFANVDAVDELVASGYGGIVWEGFIDRKTVQSLDRAICPVVLVEGWMEGDSGTIHSVRVDNRKGAFLATRFLIDHGHARIAHVTVTDDHPWVLERMSGYRKALEDAGLRYDAALVYRASSLSEIRSSEGAGVAVARLEERLDVGATAVFAATDPLAECVYRVAAARARRIPDDISVVGFDNFDMALDPPLTSVSHMTKEVGERAAQILLAKREAPQSLYLYREIIEPTLVVRNSVAACPVR